MKRGVSAASRQFENRYLDLVERNEKPIRRLCHGWARSAVEAEDLFSEVLLQLWQSLPTYRGGAQESTWVYRVALNVVMMAARSRDRRQRRETLVQPGAEPVVDAAAHEDLAERQQLESLRRAVAGLEEADRTLVLLWLEELPYRRIAEITGLTENHVGVRLHRIKRGLTEEVAAKAGGRT